MTEGRVVEVEVDVHAHGVLVGLGGSTWILPSLAPQEAADIAAGLLRVAYGEDVVIGLAMCAEVGLDGAPEEALPAPVAEAVDQIVGRWRL